ncbi:hypothetical protein pb186bvf_002250 [Paramecium bursaria]
MLESPKIHTFQALAAKSLNIYYILQNSTKQSTKNNLQNKMNNKSQNDKNDYYNFIENKFLINYQQLEQIQQKRQTYSISDVDSNAEQIQQKPFEQLLEAKQTQLLSLDGEKESQNISNQQKQLMLQVESDKLVEINQKSTAILLQKSKIEQNLISLNTQIFQKELSINDVRNSKSKLEEQQIQYEQQKGQILNDIQQLKKATRIRIVPKDESQKRSQLKVINEEINQFEENIRSLENLNNLKQNLNEIEEKIIQYNLAIREKESDKDQIDQQIIEIEQILGSTQEEINKRQKTIVQYQKDIEEIIFQRQQIDNEATEIDQNVLKFHNEFEQQKLEIQQLQNDLMVEQSQKIQLEQNLKQEKIYQDIHYQYHYPPYNYHNIFNYHNPRQLDNVNMERKDQIIEATQNEINEKNNKIQNLQMKIQELEQVMFTPLQFEQEQIDRVYLNQQLNQLKEISQQSCDTQIQLQQSVDQKQILLIVTTKRLESLKSQINDLQVQRQQIIQTLMQLRDQLNELNGQRHQFQQIINFNQQLKQHVIGFQQLSTTDLQNKLKDDQKKLQLQARQFELELSESKDQLDTLNYNLIQISKMIKQQEIECQLLDQKLSHLKNENEALQQEVIKQSTNLIQLENQILILIKDQKQQQNKIEQIQKDFMEQINRQRIQNDSRSLFKFQDFSQQFNQIQYNKEIKAVHQMMISVNDMSIFFIYLLQSQQSNQRYRCLQLQFNIVYGILKMSMEKFLEFHKFQIQLLILIQKKMLLLIQLFLQVQAQVGCLFSSVTDNTKCQFCSYGYIPPASYPGICTIQIATPLSANSIYVSNASTCTSSCGSSTSQYSNLYDAINNIPYPPSGSIPTYTIFIQTDIYLTGAGYLNRRKLVNLIIRNDPSILAIPTIYIKSNALSIFTSAQLTINNLKFDGIGLNDQPYSSNTIYCTTSLQSKLFNSSDGISSSGQTCGIRYFTISQSSQSEYYGLFTTEPMFEVNSNPILSITQCSFSNLYYINSSPITLSLIQIGLNLPSIITLSNVNITNSFFQNGIINQQNYQNSILQYLNSTTQPFYDNYNLTYQQININNFVIQGYNQQFISNFANNDQQTGMILTAVNIPIQTNINQLQILGTMLMTRIYFQQNGKSQSLGDGITYGHYYLYYYKSQIFKLDQTGNMITSALNITNSQILDTYSNAYFLFYAPAQRDYFLSNKTYNIIYMNQIVVNTSATQFFLQYGNTNLLADVIQFLNGDFNNFFVANGQIFNYVGYIKIYSILQKNITGYYVDDNINEKNVFIWFDNSSVTTDWYPSIVDIYNHSVIQVYDMIQLEGSNYFPSFAYMDTIIINSFKLVYLSWHLYGCWPMYLFQFKNIQLMNQCVMSQLINIKQVPDLVLIQNVNIRFNLFMDNILQIRTNMINIPNFAIVLDNITIFCNETERQIANFSAEQIFRDNTGVFTNPSILGSVTLQNSNIMFLNSDLNPLGFFQVRSAFNFYVINCTLQFYGGSIFYLIISSYETQTIETFQIINTNITRIKVIGVPDSQLKQSDLVVIDQMDDFMPFSSRNVLIRNTSIIDSGRSFSRILMVQSQNVIFETVTLYNIGVYYSKMNGTVLMNNVNYNHNNTNSSSYFLIVEGITIPKWTLVPITLPSNQTNLIIINNTNFTGQLAQGLVQISNAIVLLTKFKQTLHRVVQLFLNKMDGYNFIILTYLVVIIIKIYKSTALFHILILILEIQNTQFLNSMGSYGGFIYCYGMYGYLKQTTFLGGNANNGGAMYVINSQIIIQNSNFGITQVTYTGGHIFIESSQLSISNSLFLKLYCY